MKLIIFGASGHGKVVADIPEKNGYDEIEFYDDDESISSCGKWPVVGQTTMARNSGDNVFIAIGNATIRERLMKRFCGCHFPILIHPNAVVADDVVIGEGSVVMAGAVINPGAKIGRGAIVNTTGSIDHDCVVGDYVHIAVGAHLCGSVSVGDSTWIGAGSIINNNVRVCADSMIGSGAVVITDIEEKGTYVGVPAKRISKQTLTRGGRYVLTTDLAELFSERRAA